MLSHRKQAQATIAMAATDVPNHGWTKENFASTGEERGLDLATFLERVAHINSKGLPVRLSVKEWAHADDLLMLDVEPEEGFIHLATDATVTELYDEGYRYHISLCFRWELPAEDVAAYERIRQRYHGRQDTLSVEVWWACGYLSDSSPLGAELLQDPDIHRLHAAGRYAERELHVSM
jgi:hypothetical protein